MKKYAAYIVLLLAGLLLFFIKSNQRGSSNTERIEVTTDAVAADEGFSRHPDKIIYTKHARCRMECRHISENDIQEIILTGNVNSQKIEQDERGKTYPLEGKTKDDKRLRVVVAPKKNDLVVVTVIDLDTEWPCGDCH